MGIWGLKNRLERCFEKEYQQDIEVSDIKEDAAIPSPKAIIYKSELDFISRCILDYPNIETGGELFGFWTQLGTPIVMYAVGPGPQAKHYPTSFVQDPGYVDNIEVNICNQTGLLHIGQWHSHHQLSLAQPSRGDVASMQRGVGQPGFPRALLCIGNCTPIQTTINAFNFHENTPGQYKYAQWEVIELESPFRISIKALFHGILYEPHTIRASHGQMNIYKRTNTHKVYSDYRQHWLTKRIENVETMKDFLKSAAMLCAGSTPITEIMESGEPIISLYNGFTKIMFPYGFPEKSPQYIIVNQKECKKNDYINIEASREWNHLTSSLDVKFYNWLSRTIPVDLSQARNVDGLSNTPIEEVFTNSSDLIDKSEQKQQILPQDLNPNNLL